MTTQPGEGTTVPLTGRSPDEAPTVTTVLRATGGRIRRDPALVVLFAMAGFVVAVADWLRGWDPVPAGRPNYLDQTVALHHSVFPRGLARTARDVDGLVGLRPPYFVGALALELLVVLAVGLAGWLAITRLLDGDRGIASFVRYQGALAAVLLVPWALGTPSVEYGSPLLGLLALVVVLLFWIRLFLVPGFLATGRPLLASLKRSVRETGGMQGTLFVLVVVLGLGCWALVRIPTVGGFLTTGVIALGHAVTIAVVLDHVDDGAADRSAELNQPTRM